MFLCIELVGHDKLTLRFQILANPFADLWLERMNHRGEYPLDHPKRFYGFENLDIEIQQAEAYIQQQIKTINDYQPIIDRPFTRYNDQDCLNYLHNIFERFHGQLDQQDNNFWKQTPPEVKQALAELNLAVHRCESVARGSRPRFVCTWYGMPKTLHLPVEHMLQCGSMYTTFGTVYLNYCEIGKTLEDMTMDRDTYMADNMFRPFDFYSADFSVRFWDDTTTAIDNKLKSMQEYYNTHQQFFHNQGYKTFDDPRLLPLRFPVAQLVETMPREQLLTQIQQRQCVSQVYIE